MDDAPCGFSYPEGYVPSPDLMVLKNHNGWLLTRHMNHEDYAVWQGGRVIAQGGGRLMGKIFAAKSTQENTTGERKEPAMTETSTPAAKQVTIEQRIDQYVKLRDMIKAKDDAHKKAMEPYRETLEKLNGVMLNHLNTIGADSVKASSGTVYRTTKRSASLEDGDAFMRHVITKEAWELLDRKANVAAVEAYFGENGVLPPGVKISSQQVVGVRRGKE